MIRRVLPAVALLAMALALASAARVEQSHSDAARGHILYVPPGPYLVQMALGFRSVMADLIYLWAIQYAADRNIKEQQQYLPRIFDAVTDLDPRFDDAYFTGAFIVATDAQSLDDALTLLDKGYGARGRYEFPYDAGFYCYLYAKDHARAAAYFRKAADHPDCPVYVRRLALKMAMLQEPREAYGLYVAELRSVQEARRRSSGEDRRLEGHERLVRRRIAELEISIEVEELSALADGLRDELGRPASSVDEIRRWAETRGLAVRPVVSGNDPFTDPLGDPYALVDGQPQAPVRRRRTAA